MRSRGRGKPVGWKAIPYLALGELLLAVYFSFFPDLGFLAIVLGLGSVGTIAWYLLTPRHKREMQDTADQLRASAKARER